MAEVKKEKKRGRNGKSVKTLGTKCAGNMHSQTHGLMAKYLPKEALEIVELLDQSPTEILWDSIKLQYAAILRSQKIMYVANQNTLIKELKKSSEFGEEYEIQFAWDRQEKFLNVISKAMITLAQMIEKYEALSSLDPKYVKKQRNLLLEKMEQEAEHIKTKNQILKGISLEIEDMTLIEDEIYGGENGNKEKEENSKK